MLLAIIHYLHAWKRYGTAVRELSNLNDRELADIGITRSRHPAARMGARAPAVTSGIDMRMRQRPPRAGVGFFQNATTPVPCLWL